MTKRFTAEEIKEIRIDLKFPDAFARINAHHLSLCLDALEDAYWEIEKLTEANRDVEIFKRENKQKDVEIKQLQNIHDMDKYIRCRDGALIDLLESLLKQAEEMAKFYAESKWNDDYPGGISEWKKDKKGREDCCLETGQRASSFLSSLAKYRKSRGDK